MSQTVIQRAFAPFKKLLPSWIHNPIRSAATACIGPFLFAHRIGYFRSAFKRAAVSRDGRPLPWYTYPCIEFLRYRRYDGRVVLEFGGGQSTLWWAEQAKNVVTLEGNKEWFEKIRGGMPDNVDLSYVSMESRATNVAQVKESLDGKPHAKYDVIVIDGLYRHEMIAIAIDRLADDGIVICDNAEGYAYEGFKESGLSRVDFFGQAPGVVLPHTTSIYFRPSAFAFDARYPIPVMT